MPREHDTSLCRSKRGAFNAALESEVLVHGDGPDIGFDAVRASWREAGVREKFSRQRSALKSRSWREPGESARAEYVNHVLCMRVHPELLQLISQLT